MIRTQHTNGQTKTIEFDDERRTVTVDGISGPLDALFLSEGRVHLIWKKASWNIEIVSLDRETKQAVISVNGRLHAVQLKERLDDLLNRLGMAGAGAIRQRDVRAPMPGMVIQILVKEGQEVIKDEPLLILEAMKMENVIKSPAPGVIKRVGATQGIAVEKNMVLVEFE